MSHSTELSSQKVTLRNVLMWGCAAIFYFYQFVLRASPSVMTEEIQNFLHIEACALGVLFSFYYYGYVGAQIPVGIILDRVGVRFPLMGASLLCFLGTVLFVVEKSLTLMSIGRFLIGVGSAFGFLSSLKLATVWLPSHRFSFFIGLTMLLGTTGGAAGGAPLSILINTLGWKESMLFFGVFSLIIAVLAVLLVRDHSPQVTSKGEDPSSHHFKISEAMKMILSNPQTWIIGAYGCLMYIPLSGFADLWGVSYVMTLFNVSKSEAAGSVSMFYVGIGIGCPLTALISDYIKSINKVLLWGAILTCLFMLTALYCTTIPFYLTYALFLFAGMASSVQFLVFVTVTNINPTSISGTGTAIHNMICMISGVAVQPLIGFILDLLEKSEGVAQCGVHSAVHYKMALSIVPLSVFLAIMPVFFIKEACSPK